MSDRGRPGRNRVMMPTYVLYAAFLFGLVIKILLVLTDNNITEMQFLCPQHV